MSAIVVAPFSNEDIRDWPITHFSTLIGILTARRAEPIRVIGTRNQLARGREVVRPHSPARVTNECGRLSWPEVTDLLRRATCVIGNNSGVAHLAAMFGVPTVCIFGGSHSRLEWRPMGFNVATVSRAIGCSPCHLPHASNCPYDKACLRQITPAEVAEVALTLMTERTAAALAAGGRRG